MNICILNIGELRHCVALDTSSVHAVVWVELRTVLTLGGKRANPLSLKCTLMQIVSCVTTICFCKKISVSKHLSLFTKMFYKKSNFSMLLPFTLLLNTLFVFQLSFGFLQLKLHKRNMSVIMRKIIKNRMILSKPQFFNL